MVRRRKTSMFLDARTDTPVLEVKKMIEGILNVVATDQQLYYLSGAGAVEPTCKFDLRAILHHFWVFTCTVIHRRYLCSILDH